MPSSPYRLKGIAIVAILFSLGIIATALAGFLGLDLKLSALFFQDGGSHGGWIYSRDVPWRELYDYGELPAVVMAIGCLGLAVAARVGKAPRIYIKPCLVVILTVIMGPGIIVNGMLKGCYGRPRPADIKVFNGAGDYREAWQPGGPGVGKSFSCGHCSMGYSVASLAAFYPYHPALAIGALVGGVVFGTVSGVARMVQGGHFATDVLWSGIIVFMVIAALYYLVFRIPEQSDNGSEP